MTGAAFLGRLDRSSRPEAFNDQGKKFFDDFDPDACTTLEVFDYDPSTAHRRCRSRSPGRTASGSIPSHYDYPADAKQRLVDTATGVIGLTKDSIRSDRVEDQEAMGVIDPLDPKATSLKGIGKRVTLKDASDKVLADFIIGKEVKDHPDQRYVRVPGQKRIYGVNVKVDLSTRFADWIETNLLKLDASRVRKVVIDHKGFNPDDRPGGPRRRRSPSSARTPRPPGPSTTSPEGKEPNTETLLALTNALGDLKIAGIRPKPEGPDRRPQGGPRRGQADDPPGLDVAGQQGVLPDPRTGPALEQGRGHGRRPTRAWSTPSATARSSSPPATSSRPGPSPQGGEGPGQGRQGRRPSRPRGPPKAATCSSPPPSTPP